MLLDECVEVYRIQVVPVGVRKPGNVTRFDCVCHPLDEVTALFSRAG